MGKETQRCPSNTGADGPAFVAPETHSRLKGSGVSCGSGRRWALPRGCGSRAQAAPNSVGASTEGTSRPRRTTSRGPPTDQVDRGSGNSAALEGSVPGPRLTARLRPRKASAAAASAGTTASGPRPHHPPSPLSSKPGGREGGLPALRTNRRE